MPNALSGVIIIFYGTQGDKKQAFKIGNLFPIEQGRTQMESRKNLCQKKNKALRLIHLKLKGKTLNLFAANDAMRSTVKIIRVFTREKP